MASIVWFGRYLPERVVGNAELAGRLECDPAWIFAASGIEERRIAAPGETVADMAVEAARGCPTGGVGMVVVASGTGERRFPGPAAEVAHRLGLAGVPAIDLPMASAGSLFGMALAGRLAGAYGDVLVLAAEKMGSFCGTDKNTAILFGDGAGACLVSAGKPGLAIVDAALHSDGAYANELALEQNEPIRMNGPTVIMQAARKIPAGIGELLRRNGVAAGDVGAFILHQANQNLIDRVARALKAEPERFYSNIRKYGNTSSASMLIAASEWRETARIESGEQICFAAFGAGFHWGAVLCRAA
jgi:3-oxoacyl-[acyl-carrier-protein] synthase-3